MDDDEDEDMGSPPLENPLPRDQSLPPHMQNQSYMRTAASASPPVPNVLPMYQRQGTPQAQMISRPGSRNTVRRSSSNLGPSHLQQVSQPPQAPNGYAYMRTPPAMYNAQSSHNLSGSHHRQPSQGQVQYYNQLQQVANSQVQQAYLQDQRRQSMSNSYPAQESQPQHQAHVPSPPQTDTERQQDEQRLTKPMNSKSHSIFTPIDDSRSLLAQHWGSSKTSNQSKPEIKLEKENQPRLHPDRNSNHSSQPTSPPPTSHVEPPIIKRSDSTEFVPPSRSDSQMGAKRPRLKVQIPEEQSEAGSPTSETSPRPSGNGETPAKGSAEASHSSGTGVVLPPPSPSASALLSAGAQGPPNPFARPAPPPMGSQQRNDNIETPISALPSRFVQDGLLPSPSSFYPEWSYGRAGGDSANILPSPLNFQMPVPNGPNFGRDEDGEKKRKSPENETPQVETMKRVKT